MRTESSRRGGARLSALLLALTAAAGLTLAAPPHEAHAAEGEQLYCIARVGTKLVPFKGNGTVTDLAVPSGHSFSSYVAAEINSKWVVVNTTTCTANDSLPIGGVDYSRTNVDSGIYGSIGGTKNISPQIRVDNDGRLWFGSGQETVATANTYRFSQITYGTGSNEYCGTLLLGHRVADETQTAGTVINQSPTAGAPVSDLTIPALAVGGGLAAVGFGLSRRRRA